MAVGSDFGGSFLGTGPGAETGADLAGAGATGLAASGAFFTGAECVEGGVAGALVTGADGGGATGTTGFGGGGGGAATTGGGGGSTGFGFGGGALGKTRRVGTPGATLRKVGEIGGLAATRLSVFKTMRFFGVSSEEVGFSAEGSFSFLGFEVITLLSFLDSQTLRFLPRHPQRPLYPRSILPFLLNLRRQRPWLVLLMHL